MVCQLCLWRVATVDIKDRLPSGRFVEAHYCPYCWDAKRLKPRRLPDRFPRFRFTLKSIMVLVAIFAIPNSLVIWFGRSGLLPDTWAPEQVRRWVFLAFLTVNFCFG